MLKAQRQLVKGNSSKIQIIKFKVQISKFKGKRELDL